MNTGRTIFSQITDFLPLREFHKCVKRYHGDYKVKKFSCLNQFLSMAFAQLTYRESLRDIETCLSAMESKLYHMGFRSKVYRNTLANANEKRDWRIYADFAQILISIAKDLYAGEELGFELEATVYALDSTTIDLCLSLFPWALFRKHKGAIKMHTLMSLRGNIPCFISITQGKKHDVNIIDELILESGAFYIMDRAYIDFVRLYVIHQSSAFYVTRAKRNLCFQRRYSYPVDKTTGLRSDQLIILTREDTATDYPEPLRRIRYYDAEKDKNLIFLTNNFSLPALTICQLYKSRWQVEQFFKWIKQHLRIKAFYGTSMNEVKTQIWIAVSVYVLIAILKKRLQIEQSLYTILQILSLSLFEKTPILQLFTEADYKNKTNEASIQLSLFEL